MNNHEIVFNRKGCGEKRPESHTGWGSFYLRRHAQGVSRAFYEALDIVYPNRCGFCGRQIETGKIVCSYCNADVDSILRRVSENKCDPASSYLSDPECEFDSCTCAAYYQGNVKSGLLRLKYDYGFNAANYFCPILADRLAGFGIAKDIDVISFVPMTKRRKNLLGYNQAEYIADFLSQKLGKPVVGNIICKRKINVYQHRMNYEGRKLLAMQSYFAPESHEDISGKTVLLCDDIVTTGSTLFKCSGILKSIGAKAVHCAVIAMTAPHKE